MYVAAVKIKIRFVISFSLKDKRMRLRSIKDKFTSKFKTQLTEVELQDNKNFTVLGFSFVTGSYSLAQSIEGKMVAYIEDNCEDEIVDIDSYIEKF
ncbi:DUF503 domain-containing protein [Ilyobacter polytropus]|uniref:DUF503 domain-containing protein n=1 Tax=Ilyobacter polytropus (strain ATCC 51220 / DSM 2926 / LMG 16218 / CuHBu1) TaxID=572544 RepID=E3H8K8_ILYPC|nr:DUF503 domain-containing protein [Ilyobacter polytropus]ADO82990.1 protein of unknown function DUF503 [Ilyobacter polytropus DSM 2926]